ncbi:MAG: hypothetical protein Fues2KO_27430 [Fuerstiella sp.]
MRPAKQKASAKVDELQIWNEKRKEEIKRVRVLKERPTVVDNSVSNHRKPIIDKRLRRPGRSEQEWEIRIRSVE